MRLLFLFRTQLPRSCPIGSREEPRYRRRSGAAWMFGTHHARRGIITIEAFERRLPIGTSLRGRGDRGRHRSDGNPSQVSPIHVSDAGAGECSSTMASGAGAGSCSSTVASGAGAGECSSTLARGAGTGECSSAQASDAGAGECTSTQVSDAHARDSHSTQPMDADSGE